ncbi:DUF5317 domain-containing protein [Paramaledivibacter caminithermalis]|jgi:hypothetical protein|uniref:DUF5317 domain-containing protein n=1 Tax=Paramaledivibacter caminithermalis (strain DSM 15212 / CIP 107654 / DViRD3) TaxID=1121301 RepID=A0A1M6L7Y3_PARC5|nr:DUF5317 domain-containing protein [Paramaledivibacter caminithermalis]SHJ67290.1 hypothetical protein SAMN02745912_00706 [Paramaledivibacter caminithermalis DSM 15212]
MFIEAVILGIIIGLVRNGSIRNISMTKIRGWFLIVLAFLIQIFLMIMPNISIVKIYGRYFYVASLALIILTLLINLNKKGMWIILIGAIFNFIVIFMNDFKMPISLEGLKLAGLQNMIDGIKSGDIINYMPLNEVGNWTKHLGKYIVIPKPYPMAKVISVGDVLISLGIIMLVQGEMLKSYLTTRGRMIRVGYRPKL